MLNSSIKGMLIAVSGIIILSPDSLMIRLIQGDYYAIIALRGLFTALGVGIIFVFIPSLRSNFKWNPVILYGIFFGLGMFSFTLSIKYTYVANTLIIFSTAPIISAILSYFILNEKTSIVTWLTSLIIAIGITVIFFDAINFEHLLGNIFALISVLTLVGNSIIARKNKNISIFGGLIIGGCLLAIITSPFAKWDTLGTQDLLLVFVNGAVVVSISFLLISYAFKLLPPVEVNLFFLLETVLGSLWVWLAIGEIPSTTTLIASAFILPILLAHSLWKIKIANR